MIWISIRFFVRVFRGSRLAKNPAFLAPRSPPPTGSNGTHGKKKAFKPRNTKTRERKTTGKSSKIRGIRVKVPPSGFAGSLFSPRWFPISRFPAFRFCLQIRVHPCPSVVTLLRSANRICPSPGGAAERPGRRHRSAPATAQPSRWDGFSFATHTRIKKCGLFSNASPRQKHVTNKSRQAEPVKAAGIVRPLWIAEINRAAGERVGLHGLPID